MPPCDLQAPARGVAAGSIADLLATDLVEDLQVLARLDIDVPSIRVWGDEYRRIGRFESDYHTLAGTVPQPS
jgi:hypothetical protein